MNGSKGEKTRYAFQNALFAMILFEVTAFCICGGWGRLGLIVVLLYKAIAILSTSVAVAASVIDFNNFSSRVLCRGSVNNCG